ncbi:hypothetical protein KP509_02G100600 [Ceratopteris richardii]|uniref:Mechanosensitive ion channel MscS domain-containing protein n=1 Tax=Ceratopteris richardii TaxID=49495 RepID=A0A8T2V942_CERRI|nr:hypothetical protein KP509_02G100600 [Ceratopteris richardii]
MDSKGFDEVSVSIGSHDKKGGASHNTASFGAAHLLVDGNCQSLHPQNVVTFHDSVQTQRNQAWEEANEATWGDFSNQNVPQVVAIIPVQDLAMLKDGPSLSSNTVSGTNMTASGEPGHRSADVAVHLHDPNLVVLHDSGSSTPLGSPLPAIDVDASSCSAVGNHAKLSSKQPIRTVTLNKELLKTRTKSRLVESTTPFSTETTVTASVHSMKKSDQPSASQSARKIEVEAEEEDPFADIDLKDKFRRGNRKPFTIAQWVVFFVQLGCLISLLTVKRLKSKQILGLHLWKWALLVLTVLCGRLVSGWLIRIVVLIAERNFLLRKKVLYFVYGLRKGVQNVLWLWLVLLAWKLMFDPRVERSGKDHKILSLLTKLFECLLIGAFIWLAKLLLMKSIAASFHVSTFFDRIRESLYNQHVLDILSNPPLMDLPFEAAQRRHLTISLVRGSGAKTSHANDPVLSFKDLQKVNQKNISVGLMKRLMNLVKHPGLGTLVTTIDKSVDSDDIEINSELEAKAAGKRIFSNVAQPGARSIVREDLLKFMSADELPRAICLFEGCKETGEITKKALMNWVVNVYQERKALAFSLNDTKTAVKELHRMASVLVIIIIILICGLILGIATTKVLLFISSQLLLVGFIFNNTLKQTFEAVIFLFVMHPFDVGDRCIIDGQHLIVEEMKILTTIFLKPDNEKVFYPNSVLATKAISNLFRSPNMKEFIQFSIHISTSPEKINAFRDKLALYLEGKTEHWAPQFSVTVNELNDLNSMGLSVSLQHTINFQNFGERMNRRSELLLEIRNIFTSLHIEYRLLPQTVELTYPPAIQSSPSPAPVLAPFYTPTPHSPPH